MREAFPPLSAKVIYFVQLISDSVHLLCLGVGTAVFASGLGLPVWIYPVPGLLLPDMIVFLAA